MKTTYQDDAIDSILENLEPIRDGVPEGFSLCKLTTLE